MRLYIIGNGFDLAHDLKTSYWHFREYLERNEEEFLVEFEKLYGYYPYDPDEYHVSPEQQKDALKKRNDMLYEVLWREFEFKLGKPAEFEFDIVCDSAIDEMNELESGPIGIEDTLNQCFEEQFGFVANLQVFLLKWAKQIRLNKAIVRKDELKNSTDLFLTFNYTPTLECLYGISKERICHIHGGIPPYCEDAPVIGHGNTESIRQWQQWKEENDNIFDEGGASKCIAISNFYSRTLKDTRKRLERNGKFFSCLDRTSEVMVIGHSLGDVDMVYFEKVVEMSGKDIPWVVVFHNESEKERMENRIKDLGISKVKLIPTHEYWDR